MKRFFCLLLILVSLCSFSFATEIDLSSMSVAELQELITAARNELTKRAAQSEDRLFIVDETDGLQIYLTGENGENWMGYYDLGIVVVNNSDRNVSIAFDKIIINGWETSTLYSAMADIEAGNSKKGAISLIFKETGISSCEEVQDLELAFHTFDPSTYNTIKRYGAIKLFFDGSNWFK